jgi:hypothetical protein
MDNLIKKFFSDPDWAQVEKMILDHIEPLLNMTTIDTTQPAEHVKAEIIGRTIAYNSLITFLNQSKLVGRPITPVKNPFR